MPRCVFTNRSDQDSKVLGNREAFPGAVGYRKNKEKQGKTSVEFDG
jgi:hypothetical protein